MPKTAVKILRNVIHKAAILKKDSVHTLPDDEAERLIDGEHAEEHDAPAPKPKTGAAAPAAPEDDSPRGILSKMKRPELLAAVEKWNKENPDKEQITVAGNASNKDIVDALLKAAGYANQ